MKIVIDIGIPYIKGVFEPFFSEVLYKNGVEIQRNDVKNADVLVIRTRTLCNEALLSGSHVKVISSATVGIDHIDKNYCQSQGIEVFSASGCNASAVLQWVLSALFQLSAQTGFEDRVLGVIGAGRIGRLVVKAAEALNLPVLQCDPPRARLEGRGSFVPLSTLLRECNIFSFHTPLTQHGLDATWKMVGDHFFSLVQPGAWIINSARGGVIDESVMQQYINSKHLKLALDVWENEPLISIPVLNSVNVATPHIAGYSKEGKLNATIMAVRAVGSYFSLKLKDWKPDTYPLEPKKSLDIEEYTENRKINYSMLIDKVYPIRNDDKQLRENPNGFEIIRNNYPLRYENGNYIISCKENNLQADILRKLGFSTQ